MTQRASGWYDDPQDDSQLRYFDGIMWSERTMPKVRPGLDHVGQARPVAERAHESQAPRRDGEPRTYPAHWGPESSGQAPSPFAPPHQHQHLQTASGAGSIGGLGARFVANIIDRLVIGVVVSIALMTISPDTLTLMQDWLHNVVTTAQQGSSSAPAMPGPLESALVWMSLGTAALGVLYDTIMTALCGGRTLGRMALGLKVVPAQVDAAAKSSQRVPWAAALVRSLIKWGPEALGGLGELVQIVIFLAALGNPQRQGLHDRLARTVVRRTR